MQMPRCKRVKSSLGHRGGRLLVPARCCLRRGNERGGDGVGRGGGDDGRAGVRRLSRGGSQPIGRSQRRWLRQRIRLRRQRLRPGVCVRVGVHVCVRVRARVWLRLRLRLRRLAWLGDSALRQLFTQRAQQSSELTVRYGVPCLAHELKSEIIILIGRGARRLDWRMAREVVGAAQLIAKRA
eukprot:3333349-Pleurochrysis_carterae.AAC.1